MPAGKYTSDIDYNRALLLEKLRYNEIKTLKVCFSGSNDSGDLDIAEIVSVDEDDLKIDFLKGITVPEAKMPPTPAFDVPGERDWKKNPATLYELIVEQCYSELESQHGGWEIDQGLSGEFVFEPLAGHTGREKMTLQVWDTEHDDYDYEDEEYDDN